jgi:cation transport ATPase
MGPASPCFHCGEPVAVAGRFTAEVDGEQRNLCCAGCEAAARLIAEMGLERYYLFREQGGSPRPPEPGDTARFEVYDRPQVLACVSQGCGGGSPAREADILLEGIRCAACGWLIEKEPGGGGRRGGNPCQPGDRPRHSALGSGQGGIKQPDGPHGRLGYKPHPVLPEASDSQAVKERRAALRRLIVAGLGMMQAMMFAVALYSGQFHGMDDIYEDFLRGVSMLVATPVVLYAGLPIFLGAFRDLRNGRPGMDVPVAIAIGGAYAASVWITFAGGPEVYFDSVSMFTFFLLTARYVEMATAVAATSLAGSGERALALAAALEAHSDHPLAGAFAQPPAGAQLPEAQEVRVVAGRGLEGLIDGVRYRIGNRAFIADWLPASGLPDDAKAGTEVLLATPAGLLASFTVEDQLRPGTAQALAQLRQLGLEPRLASGDQPAAVAAVAGSLGIRHWQAGLLPAGKLALTRELQAAGRRVAMVGDGINDAPVLAGADVSIALARGTPLAQNAAGIVLLGESLAPLPVAVRLARRTLVVIRQNLALSLGYNISAIPLAAMGLIPPWLAAIGMSLSSLVVVLNALRLGRTSIPGERTAGGTGGMLAVREPAR